ncbi:spore coat protein CotJB, partial [[Clostridium] scindens]
MMNRKQLLRKLQMLDFAIQETALFLNSHPDDRQAMQYYQSAVKEREKVAKEYE